MINAIVLIPEITKGMKSIGSKSLLKIKNKFIIEHQIEQLLCIHKNIQITVATGFDHEKISKILQKYPRVDIIHNSNYENTNFGKSIELYLQTKNNLENFLLISSGILFKRGTLTSAILKHQSKIFFLDRPKNNFDIGSGNGTNIEYLFYDLPETWSECVYLNSTAIKALKLLVSNKSIEQMYVFEIINSLLSQNVIFEKQLFPKNNFLKILSIKDVNKAKVFI